jgi:hypothetical protein
MAHILTTTHEKLDGWRSWNLQTNWLYTETSHDNLISLGFKRWYEDLNVITDKIYAHNTYEAWLYEQP